MMMNILNIFFELFFPRLCICCSNRLILAEKHLCLKCKQSLPRTKYLAQTENKLEVLFAGRFVFENIASFAYFTKGGKIQKIIHEIKYKNNPQLALYMGELCGDEIKQCDKFNDIDVIVPIPLHKKRLKKRGYNQSLLIAQGIARRLEKPVDDKNLIRTINNPTQTKNNRFERWKNTEGIFEVTDATAFKEKHILLIDDVVTTGSTLEVCAKLILKCPNAKASIYCIGSTV